MVLKVYILYFQFNFSAPPRIRREELTTLHVSEGDTIVLSATIEGEPRPFQTWYRRLKDPRTTDRLQEIRVYSSKRLNEDNVFVENTANSASLRVKNAGRWDQGEYVLVAENCYGRDEASVEVHVGKFLTASQYLEISMKHMISRLQTKKQQKKTKPGNY